VGEYEFSVDIRDEYERAALRIFNGGTQAEHIYDTILGSGVDD